MLEREWIRLRVAPSRAWANDVVSFFDHLIGDSSMGYPSASVIELTRRLAAEPTTKSGRFDRVLGDLQVCLGQSEGGTAAAWWDGREKLWRRSTIAQRHDIVAEYVACELQALGPS